MWNAYDYNSFCGFFDCVITTNKSINITNLSRSIIILSTTKIGLLNEIIISYIKLTAVNTLNSVLVNNVCQIFNEYLNKIFKRNFVWNKDYIR